MSKLLKPMYRFQNTLPKLPVPRLQDTVPKYLESIKPFVSSQELGETERKAKELLVPNGLGEILQKRLIERSESLPQGWLIDWWNELAYFGYRDPVVINVNYFYHFCDFPANYLKNQHQEKSQLQTARAAMLVQAAMKFRKLIVDEELEPDMMKTTPLCMSQYKYMFNSCRIPLPGVDTTATYDPEKNTQLCVLRNNQFYTFDLLHGNRFLSTAEIQHQLNKVKNLADLDSSEPIIGLLTTENRDTFSEARKKLLNIDPINKESLERIQSSVFIVCLDKTSPETRAEVGRALWHGDGRNRFFDKSLQFIAFENGKTGLNAEHSKMDGTPSNRCTEFMISSLIAQKIEHGDNSIRNLPEPEKLRFKVNSEILNYLQVAGKNFDSLIEGQDHAVLAFFGYGKNTIKKFNLSPDAFVQMSIQLAYYKMFGTWRATYESAQTKKYLNGRTEVVRTVSNDSVAWVKAMQTDISDQEKYQLLQKAVSSHVKYMNQAVDGHGVDRHLLGLRLLCSPEEKKKVELFSDVSFSRSSHWSLSTSQITSEYYDGYGWGQVVPDGFGVAYMIKDNSIHYNIANMKQFCSSSKFTHYLEESLLDLQKICEKCVTTKAKL